MGSPQEQVTILLKAWIQGDPSALDNLIPLIYPELRKLARYHMSGERPNHTMQATALVHEAFMELVRMNAADWPSRKHFFAAVSQIMRRALVDYARKKRSYKRGAGQDAIPIDQIHELAGATGSADDMVTFDDAMRRLEAIDARKARVIELGFRNRTGVQDLCGFPASQGFQNSETSPVRRFTGDLCRSENCRPRGHIHEVTGSGTLRVAASAAAADQGRLGAVEAVAIVGAQVAEIVEAL